MGLKRKNRVKTAPLQARQFSVLHIKFSEEQGEATAEQKSEHRLDFGLLASK